jgi:hypothetical protein
VVQRRILSDQESGLRGRLTPPPPSESEILLRIEEPSGLFGMPKEKKPTSGHGQDSLEGSVLYCVSERPSDAINIILSELPKENTAIRSQEVMQHTAELQPYHSDAILIKPQDHILRKCIDELNQANQHQKITDLASDSLCLELPTNLSDNSGVRPIEHGWTAEIVFESCKCSIPNNEGQHVAQPEA